MKSQKYISEFMEFETIAVIGVSRNPKKFGNYILNELIKKGKEVFPVNPYLSEINGIKCHNSIDELPSDIQRIVFVTKPKITNELLLKAEEKGINNIWFQQGSSDNYTIELCRAKNINFVSGQCILMYLEPVNSIHKFHKIIWKLFGKYAA